MTQNKDKKKKSSKLIQTGGYREDFILWKKKVIIQKTIWIR